MKRIISFLFFNTCIIAFAIANTTVSIPAENAFTIPVDFVNSGYDIYIGFSTKEVTSLNLRDSNSDGEITENIAFTPDRENDVFTTGPFYCYAQIFTQRPVKIIVESASALSPGNIQWNNKGKTNTDIPDSSDSSGKIVYLEDSGDSKLAYPRTANAEFIFEIPFSSLRNTTAVRFEGTMKVRIQPND